LNDEDIDIGIDIGIDIEPRTRECGAFLHPGGVSPAHEAQIWQWLIFDI